MMDLSWIDEFLPLFRCPDTHQALRLAAEEDLRRHGRSPEEKGLVTEDGSRYFPIDQGIPILLPQGTSGS
ncbi:MAG TPA: hypothetical protein VD994_09240 [Prosthecobacter sp.]|nr:hypothetical protein [Prosthecobacter sp.]